MKVELANRIRRPLSGIQESILHVLLALMITGSILTFPLDFIEAPLYDLRQILSVKPKADDRIVLITVDDETINQSNEVFPLPLSMHQKALDRLEEQNVKAIGYLLDFNTVERIDPTPFQNDASQNFVRSAIRFNAQGIPLILGNPFTRNGEETPPYPLNQIPQAVARVHQDGLTFGKDSVTRRALVSLYDRLAFEMALASRLNTHDEVPNPPGTYRANDIDAQYFLFKFHQTNNLTYDPNYETFPYTRYSYIDLIEGKIPPGTLQGKIVLIGSYQRENPNDFTLINSRSKQNLMPRILVHANILDSILNEQGMTPVPASVIAILCFLLSVAVILASLKVRPSHLITLTAYLIAGTFAVSLITFQPIPFLGNWWLNTSRPLISLVLSFYLMIPLRLYSEHRKRYALEKQNKLLLEVEEMKTNFLQLVTHDLKTPVARMQGLTESLKRSLMEKLSGKDIEMFTHIFYAIEELNHFITSLLELTKLDNQGLLVELKSKDINQLLETIVLKHRFAAQAKAIQIQTLFEPLFPLKFDVELISKVLSNLIDNAIKYSPDHTLIQIQTREVDSYIEISIADQGIGIPDEELQNLFSRFYRIKNDTTQKVKGTGLGLYLSKYFIEAHRGSIEVESEPGKGTRFIIRLPIALSESEIIQPGLKIAPIAESNKENANA